MKLQGKTVIITGASSGIGAATAQLFASEGANLVIGARRQDRLDHIADLAREQGATVVTQVGDVQDEAYAEKLVELAISRFGQLDVAFNNAGIIGQAGPVTAMSADEWGKVIQTNLTSAFYGAKHQIPVMQKAGSGSVIFTSSFVGHTIGFPGMAAYGASKAGLIGLTQCLATEYGAAGVRINALLPGGTKTNMVGDFSDNPDAESQIASFHALKRMADPMEIAKAALFLASGESSFVTGSAVLVDGGNSITKV